MIRALLAALLLGACSSDQNEPPPVQVVVAPIVAPASTPAKNRDGIAAELFGLRSDLLALGAMEHTACVEQGKLAFTKLMPVHDDAVRLAGTEQRLQDEHKDLFLAFELAARCAGCDERETCDAFAAWAQELVTGQLAARLANVADRLAEEPKPKPKPRTRPKN